MRINFDKIGATVSSICVIHCILLPIVISIIPFVTLRFIPMDTIETVLLISAYIAGIFASCRGWQKHKKWSAPFLISSGLFLLLIGRLTDHNDINLFHTFIMILAGFVLVSGHLINHKLCHKSCSVCADDLKLTEINNTMPLDGINIKCIS